MIENSLEGCKNDELSFIYKSKDSVIQFGCQRNHYTIVLKYWSDA